VLTQDAERAKKIVTEIILGFNPSKGLMPFFASFAASRETKALFLARSLCSLKTRSTLRTS